MWFAYLNWSSVINSAYTHSKSILICPPNSQWWFMPFEQKIFGKISFFAQYLVKNSAPVHAFFIFFSQRRRRCVQVVSGASPSRCRWAGCRLPKKKHCMWATPIFEIFESPTALQTGVDPLFRNSRCESPRSRTRHRRCAGQGNAWYLYRLAVWVVSSIILYTAFH